MIVRGESTIIDYQAPFDQGLMPRNFTAQQHLNEIRKNKHGKAVQLIFEMLEISNHKQHERTILKQELTYLEQILLICDGKLFKIFPARGKRLQFNTQ